MAVHVGLFGNDNPGDVAAAGNKSHQEDMLLQQLESYWTWMQSDDRISGMWPWHWWCLLCCPKLVYQKERILLLHLTC